VTEQDALAVPLLTLSVALRELVALFVVTYILPLEYVSQLWFEEGVTVSVFFDPDPYVVW